jgi:hypothetical protein
VHPLGSGLLNMDSHGFDKRVLQEFSFLLDGGFAIKEVDPTRVVFVCELYFVNVFYGRRTREIGIEVASTTPSGWGSFSFDVLISVFDKQAGSVMPLDMPVETRTGVEQRVGQLAAEFRHFVDLSAFKSTDLFENLKAHAKRMWESRYSPLTVEQVQARFSRMWENGQYADLINMFEALRKHLTADEQLKLDLAKQALSDRANRTKG